MDEKRESPGANQLVALLGHQRTLYRQLRVLADRQKALVVQDDPEALLALLGERQRLVDGLVGLNARLAPFRARWSQIYNGLDESRRKEVSLLLEEVNSSLGAILQSDRTDTATLTARQQDMAGQLATFNTGSRASAAYSQSNPAAKTHLTDARA